MVAAPGRKASTVPNGGVAGKHSGVLSQRWCGWRSLSTVGGRARHFGRSHALSDLRLSGAVTKQVDTGDVAEAERVRGGGRKKNIEKYPGLLLELDDLVSPEARGDPMSPLRWTPKDAR